MCELLEGLAGGGGRVDGSRSAAGGEAIHPATQQVYLEPSGAAPTGTAHIISNDRLSLPGSSAPITPHFLTSRSAVFVPHPVDRVRTPLPASGVFVTPVGAATSTAAATKQDGAEKEEGGEEDWQRTEIKKEPGEAPEEGARGLLARHKQHYPRLGQDGQSVGDELKREAHLARHQRIHSSERPHACNVCFKVFDRRGHFQRHLNIHDPPCDEPRPRHPCDLCGNAFLRREHMLRYRKMHTAEKEHVCYLCGKAFFRRDHVRQHEATHAKSGSAAPTGRGELPPPAVWLQSGSAAAAQSLGGWYGRWYGMVRGWVVRS